MTPAIRDDEIARVLRDHFMSEEHDAGFRAAPLAREGGPSSGSPDAAMVSRVATNRQDEHRRVREALRRIGEPHADVLRLAYGVVLRDRDVLPARGTRRAIPWHERGWRERLRETFGFAECAIVLASRAGETMYASYLLVKPEKARGRAEWLLSVATRAERERIEADARGMLIQARALFARAYEPRNAPRLDARPGPRRRRTNTEEIRARMIAEMNDNWPAGRGHGAK